MSNATRIAVVGLGNMGQAHCRDLASIDGADLCAVVDVDASRRDAIATKTRSRGFESLNEAIERGDLNAVVVATPHPSHRELTEQAFAAGLHVLVEKPVAIDIKDGLAINDAYGRARSKRPDLRFAIMFQQRTYGYWRAIRELVSSGELGAIIRATWIITDWFRTQVYYDSGDWRAKWRTEGGGVTMNQAPHNLDLYQWIVGRPQRLTAVGAFGKYHRIEVEDEISIVLEHESGAIGHIISSTGESPGTNRLEIATERGKLVFENGAIAFDRTDESILEFLRTSPSKFTHVPSEAQQVPFDHHGELGHRFVLENFVQAIDDPSTPLIAEGIEGVASLEIANAAIYSAWTRSGVDLPLNPEEYRTFLTSL